MPIDILFRVLDATAEGYSAPKLAELDWLELDGNFKLLADILDVLSNTGGNVTPYDNGEEYKNVLPDYVTYNGFLWRCLSASTMGVIPGSDPLIWEQSTAGSLTHVQNTDTYLSFGTANQVSAVVAAEHLNNQFINITESSFNFSVSAGLLKANRIYKITDSFPILLVHSHGGKLFSKNGWALIRTPNILNIWKGDAFGGAYALNQRVNYDGYVWRNKTGTNTDVIPPTDTTNWEVLDDSTSDYKDSYLEAEMIYSSGALTPIYYRDHVTGNNFGFISMLIRSYPSIRIENAQNDIDKTSILNAPNVREIITQNKLTAFSSMDIGENSEGDGLGIQNNILYHSALECLLPMQGHLTGNNLICAGLEFQDGLGVGKFLETCYFNFTNPKELLVRADVEFTDQIATDNGSTFEDIISAPAGVLDLEQNGYSDIYGIFSIAVGSGTVDEIGKFHNHFPVKIRCTDPAEKLTVTITGRAAVSADDQLVSSTLGAGNYDCHGVDNEYLLLKDRITVNGFDCILVEIIAIQ